MDTILGMSNASIIGADIGQRKGEPMINFLYHIFCETGFPVWGLLALGIVAMIIDNWEELTK